MSKSKRNDNLKKQHASDSFINESFVNVKTAKPKKSSPNYKKPDAIGRVGAIINIFISVFDVFIIFILFTFAVLFFFTELFALNSDVSRLFISWSFLILVLVFMVFMLILISNITASTKFLKGKDNKVSAGILCFLILNLFSGVFILVSDKERF